MCFLAHSTFGTLVIIKRFKPNNFKKNKENKENKEKNVYEAIILSQLNHNSIPKLLGVINEKGFYGFVLEFKDGFTVNDLLFKNKHIFTREEFFNIGSLTPILQKYLLKKCW